VPATFKGKSYGIIAIGSNLYMWRCGDSGPLTGSRAQRLYKSTDDARTWTYAGWEFPGTLSFYCPTFLQFGKGYSGARDNYVYMYAAERNSDVFDIHIPGRIMLMRAPKDQLLIRNSYQFFTGRTGSGDATWSFDVNARRPVIEDPNGLRLVSAAYNAGLGRYLVGYAHTVRREGNMALHDSATPWGPWTTVTYEYGWGQGIITGNCCLLWYFSPKWWLDGGKRFTIVFSGSAELDSWNTVEGTFTVAATPPPAGTSVPLQQPSASSTIGPQDAPQRTTTPLVRAKQPEPQSAPASVQAEPQQQEQTDLQPPQAPRRAAMEQEEDTTEDTAQPSSPRQSPAPTARADRSLAEELAPWAGAVPLDGTVLGVTRPRR
jgi:hypothetical protein